MKKQEKEKYMNMDSIAYYSGWSGIEIKDIKYGIDDHIIFVEGAWCSKKSVHSSKVYYTATGNGYFRYNGYRIPLNECIRMGV